jgi:nucleoside-diphosphate-sugar epimerase
VDADDIADVVVAALTEDRHAGQLYELTGPRLLSFGTAVAEITEYGLPEDFIWLLSHLFTEVLGSKAELSDGVRRGLGRDPKDFADSARAAAASGVWTP